MPIYAHGYMSGLLSKEDCIPSLRQNMQVVTQSHLFRKGWLDVSIMWHRLRECTISLPKSNTFLSLSLCIYIYTYIYIYIYVYICTFVYIYIHIYTYMKLCIALYIYIYIHKYFVKLYPSIRDEVTCIVFHLGNLRYHFHSAWGNGISMEMMPQTLMPHLIYEGKYINVIQWNTT